MATRPCSSSFISYKFTYHVFLSFRGEDTRYGFTGNLYNALHNRGIHTFIDHEKLQKGDEIMSALEKAIQESRIFIIVLSQNYASSSFCLNELAYILNFTKGKGLLVLPIFHNVVPSDVRYQKDSFGKALANHEKKYNSSLEKIKTWKMALSQVANLSGYPFKDGERYEHEFIKEVVQFVSSKINRAPLHLTDYLVGLESQMLEVQALLDVGSDDVVLMVGIHGPGGMGKTTLAVAVYNSIADHFEALCFLENVRETSKKHGLTHLQSNLLSETIGEKKITFTSEKQGISMIKHRLQQKKILLILDDVDKRKQLEALIGRPDWFGLGSRVIITTRDKQLLACHKVERAYEVKELKRKAALQLLSSKAFKLEKFDPRYLNVLNRAVTYASGFPLALEVIGSNLFEKSIEQWESTLNRYKRIPNKEIQEVLKVSYDDLEQDEQSVFLDISCCFKNYRLTVVKDILHAHYGHCMQHHIEVLVDKSLIKISLCDGKVTLHDLIEDMGKEIVRKESPKEPGKRSRLWFHEDIVQVLEENKGTSHNEIIHMDFPLFKKVEWDGDAFEKMKNLKTIIIRSGLFSKGPNHLPNSLRVLEWWRYPSHDFPNDFHPKELAICTLPNSYYTSIRFNASLEKKFTNLISLNFDMCQYLTQIQDVSCLQLLKKLSFESCHKLLTIHKSVGLLKNLKVLNARSCSKLKSFPPMKLTSLEQLQLTFCESLESFPEVLDNMANIKHLSLHGTSINKFPPSFKKLNGLENLNLGEIRFLEATKKSHLGGKRLVRLRGRENAIFIPDISLMPQLAVITAMGLRGCQWPKVSFSKTTSSNVRCLVLINCNLSDDFFPLALQWFVNLKELDLSENNFTVIPECFKEFFFLTKLSLGYCKSLEEIRGIPPNLKYFLADGCLSLTSSCKRMLLSQKLHEAGYTNFCLPRSKIPEWFQYKTRGLPISFRFRNKFPAIAICLTRVSLDEYPLKEYEDENEYEYEYLYKPEDGLVYSKIKDRDEIGNLILIIKGKEHVCFTFFVYMNITYLFDLRESICNEDKFDEALLENDWNHVEIIYKNGSSRRTLIKSGMHVLEQQNMEDIQFTDPCTKRKLDDELNNSQSKNREVVGAKTLCWRYPSEDFTYDVGDDICKLPETIFTSGELGEFLLKKKFVNLTNLNFDRCHCLTEIPNVSCLRQLENLSFRWCQNLLMIHNSVGLLEKLKILNAKCCRKLKSFPPIKLTSLEQLDLAYCDSLESFPEVLGQMENITKLNLDGTCIDLTRLQQLNMGYYLEHMSSCCDAANFLWNISMMPKLAKIEASGWKGLLRPKKDESVEKVSSTVSSNIQHLSLRNCNLPDEFFRIALQWFANVKELDLSENNFTVIPESIKECCFLTKLTLERCMCLQEIRGLPLNLKHFSAKECISLTSSSRSMLLNQELHEAGNTDFYLPGDNIPEWFERRTWGPPISFWFRNKFPTIAICLVKESANRYLLLEGEDADVYSLLEDEDEDEAEDEDVRLIVIINGYIHLSISLSMGTGTRLFDMKKLKDNLKEDEEILENVWNYAMIIFQNKNYNSILVKSGVHVLKHQSSVEDIQFIDPQRKGKLEFRNQQLRKK